MKAKNNKTTTNGNPELIEALKAIEKEKDISKDILIEAIQNSLLAACKDQFGKSDNVRVNLPRAGCASPPGSRRGGRLDGDEPPERSRSGPFRSVRRGRKPPLGGRARRSLPPDRPDGGGRGGADRGRNGTLRDHSASGRIAGVRMSGPGAKGRPARPFFRYVKFSLPMAAVDAWIEKSSYF